MDEWKAQAKALFFVEHLRITEIVSLVRKSRKTVSEFINDCEGYEAEMAFRRQVSAAKRREYQRQWDRDHRVGSYTAINADSLRQEHDMAALILSKERFYG